ncbi:MAG: DUF1189 family protein [Bdellovibrionales bacterium]
MIQTLKNLHKTFYDARFYRDLVFSWKGVGLGFLFFVSLINTTQLVYVLNEPYQAFLKEREAIFASLPEITIKDGTISSDANEPVRISFLKEIEGGPVNILIDTKDQESDFTALQEKMEKEKLLVFVNHKGVSLFSPADKKLDISPASEMKARKITHKQWMEFSSLLVTSAAPTTLFFVFCISFMGHVLTAALGAILLFIITPLFKMPLAFNTSMRLSSAAKVPVAFILLVAPPHPTLQLLIWFGFAIFGLFSAKKGRHSGDEIPPSNGLA